MKFQSQVPVRSLKKIFTSSERNTLQSRKFSKIFNKTTCSLCDALKAIFHYGRFRLRALGKLRLLLSNLFKRHGSPTQQYAGLQEGRVQRKITRNIKFTIKST